MENQLVQDIYMTLISGEQGSDYEQMFPAIFRFWNNDSETETYMRWLHRMGVKCRTITVHAPLSEDETVSLDIIYVKKVSYEYIAEDYGSIKLASEGYDIFGSDYFEHEGLINVGINGMYYDANYFCWPECVKNKPIISVGCLPILEANEHPDDSHVMRLQSAFLRTNDAESIGLESISKSQPLKEAGFVTFDSSTLDINVETIMWVSTWQHVSQKQLTAYGSDARPYLGCCEAIEVLRDYFLELLQKPLPVEPHDYE
jgi:hypothetical protein